MCKCTHVLHRLLGLAMMTLFEEDEGEITVDINDTEITDSSEENEGEEM